MNTLRKALNLFSKELTLMNNDSLRLFIKRYTLLVGVFFLLNNIAVSQNKEFAKQIINRLCSDELSGRGYINNGDRKAALFISEIFRRNKLASFELDYFQQFGFPVNTFPSQTLLKIDDISLAPGREFIVNPGCQTINGRFKITYIDSATIDNKNAFEKFVKKINKRTFIVVSSIKNVNFLFPERAQSVLK